MTAFLLTQDEIGLFSVSTVFGLAFPGFILAVRETFPAAEASWRIPTVMFAGALCVIHDTCGLCSPAFLAGTAFNVVNLLLIGLLVDKI